MCGDSGKDGEEPSSPEESGKGGGGGGGRQSVLSEQRGRGEGANGPGLEEPSGGEAGPEDVEMTSGPQDLSSSAHHRPHSTSYSTSTKSSKSGADPSSFSLHSALSGQAGQRAGASSGSERMEASGGQAQREMMATMAEMKKRLPSEKCGRRKGSTVDALHYALNCVKQVQANSEYYKLLMSSGQEEQRDATGCSLEELEKFLSEHTLKNTDSFVVLFSLADGRVKYASEQAPSILRCKRKFLESATFVELLFHQDVNVFYSHTAQPHLPPWSNSRSAALLFEYAQVKSFFCRVRGGKDRDGEMRYNPFRITPYLQMVQGSGSGGVKEDPCCLVLAERIISGYEAPRIPTDKRIFTTTHSPGCVFLEVDDRAVPLLGYLPQDLIGTSLLTCVHPEDRLLVLSMHRKVLKHAGQPPFEHPPLRLRCQSGDHITLETSWSSFINPWSRKVAFIIGRHKVRTSPLNEDVFAARGKGDPQVSYEEVKGLQSMIHKLFQKPVHNKGSSGYGSLVSNGSHEHHISVASSSDSNGNLWEDSHRQPICADVNRVKSWDQQVYLDSRSKLPTLCKPATEPPPHGATRAVVRGHEESRTQTHTPSYQQINCVDSIIRYLESCRGPALKRKSYARSVATSSSSSSSSSTSEDDKPAAVTDTAPASSDGAALDSQVCVLSAAAVVVGTPLTDLNLSTKAMSMVSVTSQCSYSSTIVHVPQPDSEVTALEDAPMGSEPADPPPARPAPSPASEELRLVGLTKEVLSAHTQKEEQEYVDLFRHRILQSPYSTYLQQDDDSTAHSHPPGDQAMRPGSAGRWTRTRTGKPKHKRAKAQDWSRGHPPPPGPPLPPHSSWPSSESSQPYAPVPQLHNPVFSVMGAQPMTGPEQPPPLQTGGLPTVLRPEQSQASYSFTLPDPSANLQSVHMESNFQSHNFESIQVQNLQNIHSYPNVQPMAPALAVSPYVDPVVTPVVAVILPSYPPYYPAMYSPPAPSMLPTPTFSIAGTGPYPQPQFQQPPDPQSPPDPVSFSPGASSSFGGDEEGEAGPPALFSSSRSSSPLQLNLLQEELPGASEGQGRSESFQEQHCKRGEAPVSESGNQATQSSEQLDLLLLQEDPRSGTGSKASCSASGASGGLGSASGSNGTSTSHTGSGNSGTSPGALRSRPEPADRQQLSFDPRTENPVWNRNIPEHILMTYQIHSRDQREVLAEDKERLRLLLPRQPWFSQEQKEELWEVHPWIRQHTIPREIDSQGCVSCVSGAGDLHSSHRPAPDSCPMESPQRDT